jgi:hypothetical protein
MNGSPNSKFQENLAWIEFHLKLFHLSFTHIFHELLELQATREMELCCNLEQCEKHIISSSSYYSTHNYNFEYVCLCFLLYSFVARKVVMFVPPHIIWSRAHRGGLSSVSFWLHHCKLWKEEEEVVVHNSQPLLFTFFGGFLIDDDNDTRRGTPPLDIFFHFIIVDGDNKRRIFKLIFWFCFLVISCEWWWQEEEHGIPSHIFLFIHLYMDRKTNVTSFFLLSKMDINCETKKQSKRWL